MPKNKVSDPITDQEIAFARLVLSGAMTDRHAAEAVGLNPDSAAYTKSKPRVRAYMLEHRAAVQQQLVQQEAEGLRRLNLDREKVLDRLWEIANLSPEMTRNSVTGQVKALSMIVAMENFIPDRRAVSSEKKSAPAPSKAQIYACPPGFASSRPKPSTRNQTPPRLSRLSRRAVGHAVEPRKKVRLPAPARRGAWPSPLPDPRERRLRTLATASPPSPTALALRKRGLLCPRHLFSDLCSRPESPFLYKKEPLCPPPLTYQS